MKKLITYALLLLGVGTAQSAPTKAVFEGVPASVIIVSTLNVTNYANITTTTSVHAIRYPDGSLQYTANITGSSGTAVAVANGGTITTYPTGRIEFSSTPFTVSAIGSTSTVTINPLYAIRNQSTPQTATLNVSSANATVLNADNVYLNSSGGGYYLKNSDGTLGARIANPMGLGIQGMQLSATGGVGVNINNTYSSNGVDLLVNNGFAMRGTNGGLGAYHGFRSTGPIPTNTLWSLPLADGTNGQAMVTNGSGNLSFATISGGGGGSTGPVSLSTGVVGTLPVGNGGTGLTITPDDNAMIGNGTLWQSKGIPDCDDATGQHLNYDTATNNFTCGVTGAGGGSQAYIYGGVTITTATPYVNIDTMTLVVSAVGTSTASIRVNQNLTISTLTLNNFPVNVPLYVDVNQRLNARAIRLHEMDVIGTLPVDKGGTGETSYTDGQILIGNTASGSLSKATLTAGSNVTITNGNGTVTIASSGGGGSSGPVSLSTGVVGTLPVLNGGTGVTTPSLVAGTNITSITGTWPNQTINAATQGSGGGFAMQPSTDTVQMAKGVYLGTNTVTAGSAYTITSTDTVVFAQGALAANPVTYTLPSAASACRNGTGQTIQITKVDTSTGAVKVKTAGTDLILGTTGQVMLHSIGQTAELISDCNSKWWPHGQGIQQTPAYIGWNGDGGSANTKISSTTYVCPMTVSIPVTVMGFTWYVQTAAAGSYANLLIYDSNMNLVVSTNALVGSFGFQTITTNPVNLSPGQYYYGWQQAVAAVAISDQPGAGNAGNGNTFCSSNADTDLVPPNPFVLGTASAKPGPAINIRIAGGRTGL